MEVKVGLLAVVNLSTKSSTQGTRPFIKDVQQIFGVNDLSHGQIQNGLKFDDNLECKVN